MKALLVESVRPGQCHRAHRGRGVLHRHQPALHAGVWDKSAKGAHEMRGRTLGIIGYGNIGSQLSVLAEALGMRVVYFDTADRSVLAQHNVNIEGQALATRDRVGYPLTDVGTDYAPDIVQALSGMPETVRRLVMS